MNKKEDFEDRLAELTRAPLGYADYSNSSVSAEFNLGETVSEGRIIEELRKAKERLDNDPTLFSGDPEGLYTYDDPVLAIAAFLYQANSNIASVVSFARADGEELRNTAFWNWAKTGIHAWLTAGDRSYSLLGGRTPTRAIVVDKDKLRIAIVGDAGYRGVAQANVIHEIKQRHRLAPFDFIIHLGDVYFAGSGSEMLHNFLGPFMDIGPQVFTLLGNHDLYFGADGYAEALKVLKQPGRYFLVENQHWRIACLDTALAAERVLRNEGLLDPGQLAWLDSLSFDDDKPLVLMSHHYIVSGWGHVSEHLNQQLSKYLKRVFAWYWGHEHSCATYDKKDVGFYGACIGNGAFLERWREPNRQPKPTWYARGRCACYDEREQFWPHGYLELELTPATITERYCLETGETYSRVLLHEN
jgi:hypothetical protein